MHEDSIFRYHEKIDEDIRKATEEALGLSVLNAEKITEGEVNHVYKITTEKGVFIARVFRNGDWPEEGTLQFIDKKLREHDVPSAKIIYHTNDSKYFPHGFMIQEYLEGKPGWKAIKDGDVRFEDFHNTSCIDPNSKESVDAQHAKHTSEGFIKIELKRRR